MEKLTTFLPAFDKRNPDPKKNYGIHGVELRMVLKGELGAVQFVLYTNWQLPNVTEESRSEMTPEKYFLYEPRPADLGYHSPKPIYEGQLPTGVRDVYDENYEKKIGTEGTPTPCVYLDGKPCHYDGSGLNAKGTYNTLLEKGSDGVWKELEDWYVELFGELK